MKNGKLIFCLGILLSLMTKNTYAQLNLVPNPSFEDTSNCSGFSNYNSSFPWFNPNKATPDYFSSSNNQCGINWNTSGTTYIGYQIPRTGDAYSGFYLYLTGNPLPTREYIETQLIDTLETGKQYKITFYVVRANLFPIAVDAVGAYLSSTIQLNPNNGSLLNCTPQINNSPGNLIIDSLNWTEISGIYLASGGEKFITIGNFHDDVTTGIIDVDSSITDYSGYYYIDDVSVFPLDSIQSLPDYSIKTNFTIFPNPTSVNLQITFSNSSESKSINIYSAEGKLLKHLKKEQGNSKTTIDVSSFSDGIYFIEARSSTGSVRKKFVVLR